MIANPMFRTIVVGTDGSETARQAVREALGLAAAIGASIELVSAYAPGSREDLEGTLREAAAEVAHAGVAVRTHHREGDAADAILDVAEELDADLIVVGSKGMPAPSASCSARCPTRSPTTPPAAC